MIRQLTALSGAVLSALIFASPAGAQTIGDRISSVNVIYSGSTFSNASALYSFVYHVPAQAAFSNTNFTLTLEPNYSNLTLLQSGGITYTAGAYTAGATSIPTTLSGNGAAGTFGTQYNYPASTDGSTSLVLGRSGNLATLTFSGGGSTTGFNNFPFTINVTLPGDWSTPGTSTGDYQYLGVDPGFTLTSDFVYDPGTNTTLVSAYNPSYASGEATGLTFTLYGGAVPEPATWAMMILGLGAIGTALRRRHGAIAA